MLWKPVEFVAGRGDVLKKVASPTSPWPRWLLYEIYMWREKHDDSDPLKDLFI